MEHEGKQVTTITASATVRRTDGSTEEYEANEVLVPFAFLCAACGLHFAVLATEQPNVRSCPVCMALFKE